MSKDSKKFLTNSIHSKIVTELNDQLNNCDEFIISVAFVTLSGVLCILESLRQLQANNIKGKILTGCYLNFTEPKALDTLLEFNNIELKILDNDNFHAKGFFFRSEQSWRVMLGSSNLTQAALTVNSEWNILFEANHDDEIIIQALSEFNKLFSQAKWVSDFINEYREIYHKQQSLQSIQNIHLQNSQISPNKVQSEALDSLAALRNDNKDKALIISATGTGKTFLSAFDVAKVKPKRCLFIVHRTNIAIKAKETFAKVIKDKTLGLYTGDKKDSTEYLFATIQTLKNPKVLESFSEREFDYIVIDEVHHAEAKSYKKVLDYFRPKFLLGMTATPERTDEADIFKLFDYNIAYEIRLHQALEEDLLCPFHYFAIEDFYVESEKSLAKDFSKLINDDRVEHIITKMNIYKFSGSFRSALMFVSNVNEAKQLAIKLTEKGISAKALTSEDSEKSRSDVISQLESNQLEVIVTVDIFNEGIDIPCVNQVILLRPTQSAIVYIQQLGRGLRKYKDKHFVVVLDFIANYDNNFLIPVALSQNNSYDRDELKKFVVSPNSYIAGQSTITFTSIAKEIIYKNIQVTNFSQLKNIKRDYQQLKRELGRIPTLVDFQKYNFISPEVVLSAKDTYYDVLNSFKEDIAELNTRQYLVLKFISKEFTPAKRLYEILILEKLLACNNLEISQLELDLREKLSDFDIDSFESALKHLSLNIFTVNAARHDYEPLISISNGKVILLVADLIKNSNLLKSQLRDLIKYNKLVYSERYSHHKHLGLAMYSKYSKKDIAHLLNQDYTNGGVNLAGYRAFDNKALLFMTFDENKKFTLHDNKFISSRSFTYYSKAGKDLNDEFENNLTKDTYIRYVFARTNKNDEYFYLGTISKCLGARELLKPKKMIEYTFELQYELPSEIWKYFEVIYKNKN
ncbi:DUF3427 domain-containing protein [Francisella sp. LA112445]|uniref:DUF3427 domain-containing protein n=1 Tax=Francisella sp. LA112445 TaxID=1395624 RepID=UPI001788B667|nr:DUF3427 domain-containing protein [Francisella sp. LA112445]QIW09209.1 DUF3427 domain-containing protein [Francisella sp. LA112445]